MGGGNSINLMCSVWYHWTTFLQQRQLHKKYNFYVENNWFEVGALVFDYDWYKVVFFVKLMLLQKSSSVEYHTEHIRLIEFPPPIIPIMCYCPLQFCHGLYITFGFAL